MSVLKAKSGHLSATFNGKPKRASTKKKDNLTVPFSVRFTPDERAWLDEKSGHRPLADYIRAQILGEKNEKRRILRKPSADSQKLASILAALGESRLSSNLNQLARHANSGSLDVNKELEDDLREAYHAVLDMRDALMRALGKEPPKEREL